MISVSTMATSVARNADVVLYSASTVNLNVCTNPSSGICSVNPSEVVESIVVTDGMDNVVLKNNATQQIDLTNQPDGLYFTTITSGDKMGNKEILKNK